MYGLTAERYQQLIDYGVANYTIEGLIRYYGLNVVQKGYMQCRQEYYSESSSVIPNALHIEHVSQLATFDSDWEACRQAEKDGVQFINDMDGLEKGFYKENNVSVADTQQRYVLDEFASKISDSPYRDSLVLKGGFINVAVKPLDSSMGI